MADDPVDPALRNTDHYSEEAILRARELLEAVPEQIGSYRILERIGHGGMGDVYRAEQRSPIRREVALKFIKLGMDTKAVIARFEAERQALAMMDHPHIAKVFDAGTDDVGRPYFVMEYVKGLPITEYADAKRLTIPQRLRLFEQVCQAIQHAHHKGVIHRDIKPSNVLVSTQDDQPFAKVIDFGVAKALSQQLTDKTLFTRHDQFIGTPQYMSPEQAEGSLDIDTRSDVYSLGVLLYELLSGSPPFNASELKLAAFEQLKKLIREVDPPAPSIRLSQSGPTLPQIATNRQSDVRRLGTLVRGELDWIVMKALEKDRRRRYEAPTSLASDIQAHLQGEAIQAAPPSKLYQLQKLLRRHKGPVITIAAVMLALLLGIVGTTWGLRQAQIAKGELESYAGKLQDAYGRWYAEANRDSMSEAFGLLRSGSSEATFGGGFRVHVDYSSGEPQVRTWFEEGVDKHRARMQVADHLAEALVYEFRTREDAIRDLKAARDNAERVLAKGILRPIGHSSDVINQGEVTSFIDWSTMVDDRLRWIVLEEAFRSPEIALRLAKYPSRVIHAVGGIDPVRRQAIRDWLTSPFRDLDRDVRYRVAAFLLSSEIQPLDLPALQDTLRWTASQSPDWFDRSTGIVSARIDRLDAKQLVIAWDTLVELLGQTEDAKVLDEASHTLTLLAPRIPTDHVRAGGDALLGVFETSLSRARFFDAIPVLKALAPRLSPEQKCRAGDTILLKLEDASNNDRFAEAAIHGLFSLAPHLPPEHVERGWTALLNTPDKYGEWYLSNDINDALVAVAPQLTDPQVEQLGDALMAILRRLTLIEEGPRRQQLYHVFCAIAPRLPEKHLETCVELLLERLSYSDLRQDACEELIKIAPVLSEEHRHRLRTSIIEVFRRRTADGGISIGAARMTGLVRLLSKDQIRAWRHLAIHVIEQSDGWVELHEACNTFVALAHDLDPAHDRDFIEAVLDAFEKKINDERNFARVVRALGPCLSADQVGRCWDRLIPFLDEPGHSSSENSASEALIALVPRLREADLLRRTADVVAILQKSTDGYAVGPIARVLTALKRRSPDLSLDAIAQQLAGRLGERNDQRWYTGVTEALAEFSPSIDRDLRRSCVAKCCEYLFSELATSYVSFVENIVSGIYWVDDQAVANILSIVDNPRVAADLMRHPACVENVQQHVLDRLEELVFHDGRAVYLHVHPDNPVSAVMPVNMRPERKFRTVDDAAAWIARNWPDFDLEAVWSPDE